MLVETFLKNKIKRQIEWNGQPFTFIKYKQDEYHQLTDEVEESVEFRGIFHEGGGYGGMLNIELYERDGARTLSKMKPMILCLYEDGLVLDMDWSVVIGDNRYNVVEKSDIKNMNIAFEISLEADNGRVG